MKLSTAAAAVLLIAAVSPSTWAEPNDDANHGRLRRSAGEDKQQEYGAEARPAHGEEGERMLLKFEDFSKDPTKYTSQNLKDLCQQLGGVWSPFENLKEGLVAWAVFSARCMPPANGGEKEFLLDDTFANLTLGYQYAHNYDGVNTQVFDFYHLYSGIGGGNTILRADVPSRTTGIRISGLSEPKDAEATDTSLDCNDILIGSHFDDYIEGGTGDDYIEGGTGNDILRGDEGADELYGGPGSDWLYTGTLKDNSGDILTGGPDADVFVIGYTEGPKTVQTGEKMNWGMLFLNLGLSLFGDVSDLSFTHGNEYGNNPDESSKKRAKMTKEVIPMIFDLVKTIVKAASNDGPTYETVNPPEAAYVTVTDFNPVEDILIFPMAYSGKDNLAISRDALDSKTLFTVKDLAGESDNTIALIELASPEDVFGAGSGVTEWDSGTLDAMLEALIDHSFVIQDGLVEQNGVDLGIDPAALTGLGAATRFKVIGAALPYTIEGDHSDYLYGSQHPDILSGYKLLSGGSIMPNPFEGVSQQFWGFAGDDLIVPGAGVANQIHGGPGSDTVSYQDSDGTIGGDSQLFVNLSETTTSKRLLKYGPFSRANNGFGGTDLLWSVENIIGSPRNDILIGNDEANSFWTTGGVDTMTGVGGNDTFYANGGTAVVTNFQPGEDTLAVDLSKFPVSKETCSLGKEAQLSLQELAFENEGPHGYMKVADETVAILENVNTQLTDTTWQTGVDFDSADVEFVGCCNPLDKDAFDSGSILFFDGYIMDKDHPPIYSPDNTTWLIMEPSGLLVSYQQHPSGGIGLNWQVGSTAYPGSYLVLSKDGNMRVNWDRPWEGGKTKGIWNSKRQTEGKGHFLAVNNNGALLVYNSNCELIHRFRDLWVP